MMESRSNGTSFSKLIVESLQLVEQKLINQQSDRLPVFQRAKDLILDDVRNDLQVTKRMIESCEESVAKLTTKKDYSLDPISFNDELRELGELASLLDRTANGEHLESKRTLNELEPSDEAEFEKLTDRLLDLANNYGKVKKQAEPDTSAVSNQLVESLTITNEFKKFQEDKAGVLNAFESGLILIQNKCLELKKDNMMILKEIQSLVRQNLKLLDSDQLIKIYKEKFSNRRELIVKLKSSSLNRSSLEQIEKRLDAIELFKRKVKSIDVELKKCENELVSGKERMESILDEMMTTNKVVAEYHSKSLLKMSAHMEKVESGCEGRFKEIEIGFHLFKMAKLIDSQFATEYQDFFN